MIIPIVKTDPSPNLHKEAKKRLWYNFIFLVGIIVILESAMKCSASCFSKIEDGR